MPKICLPSSALIKDGFDGLRTIHEAKGFDGVQLYLDYKYRDKNYVEAIIRALENTNLEVIIHLPDVVTEEDINATKLLVRYFPSARPFIHYLPTLTLPELGTAVAGWENSLSGKFDINHIADVQKKVTQDNTFFVFDLSRLMYTQNKDQEGLITNYITQKIKQLDPNKDAIHVTDKISWQLTSREGTCEMGKGICKALMKDIISFAGVVVPEYENLEFAKKSLITLRS